MTASRLRPPRHVVPAQTDHSEDKGGVVGPHSYPERYCRDLIIQANRLFVAVAITAAGLRLAVGRHLFCPAVSPGWAV
jgi:hypothetical protein